MIIIIIALDIQENAKARRLWILAHRSSYLYGCVDVYVMFGYADSTPDS